MRSRISLTVVCSITFVLAWVCATQAIAQTPLRPAASPPVALETAPAVVVPEAPVKPAADPVVTSPKVTGNPAAKAQESAEAKKPAEPAKPTKTKAGSETKAAPEKEAAAKKEEKAAAEPKTRLNSAQLLPGHTKAWVSIPDISKLGGSFDSTQFGQLAKDKAIEPFIESLKDQFGDWAKEKNVRLGVKIENLDKIYSGEMCLAGIVPSIVGAELERGSHGLVLLVDVSGKEEKAAEVLAEINRRLVKQGAVQDSIEINGATVTRSKIKKAKRLRASQTTMQTIFDGWLLASDNEKIFRDVVFRLATTKPGLLKPDALASQPAFKTVMERTSVAPYDAHLKWFLDPFGYIRLAQALADETKDSREHRDDWVKILQGQGFDAIQGAGGQLGFMTSAHELIHRTFIYAPRKNLIKEEQKRVFGLFDFSNTSGKAVVPADWVPNDVSAFFVGKWNFASALENVGFLYDAFLDDPGAFERVLQDFKNDPDMQLNIRKLIGQFDSEWTIMSATAKPIDGSSERVAIAFKLNNEADPKFVLDSIRRAIGNGRATKINLGGKDVIEVDSEKSFEDDEIPDDIDIFDDPLEDENFDDEEDDEEQVFTLFDKKYFAIEHGHLLLTNNKSYMKQVLSNKQKQKLAEMSDYLRIEKALAEIVDNKVISARQFGRLDRALEANYELLREGKMAKSNTVLAKVLNQIFKDSEQAPGEEKQELKRLDGKELPADFEKSIAPYLGIMGWANEVEDDGWRISGCILKQAE